VIEFLEAARHIGRVAVPAAAAMALLLSVAEAAVRAPIELGPDAAPAAGVLVHEYVRLVAAARGPEQHALYYAAIEAIEHLGVLAAPALGDALVSDASNAELQATYGLEKLGEAGLPQLVRGLHPKGRRPCVRAMESIAKLGARARPAVPDLASLLVHENEWMRLNAASALASIAVERILGF
jgi:hypothetical protein